MRSLPELSSFVPSVVGSQKIAPRWAGSIRASTDCSRVIALECRRLARRVCLCLVEPRTVDALWFDLEPIGTDDLRNPTDVAA